MVTRYPGLPGVLPSQLHAKNGTSFFFPSSPITHHHHHTRCITSSIQNTTSFLPEMIQQYILVTLLTRPLSPYPNSNHPSHGKFYWASKFLPLLFCVILSLFLTPPTTMLFYSSPVPTLPIHPVSNKRNMHSHNAGSITSAAMHTSHPVQPGALR